MNKICAKCFIIKKRNCVRSSHTRLGAKILPSKYPFCGKILTSGFTCFYKHWCSYLLGRQKTLVAARKYLFKTKIKKIQYIRSLIEFACCGWKVPTYSIPTLPARFNKWLFLNAVWDCKYDFFCFNFLFKYVHKCNNRD